MNLANHIKNLLYRYDCVIVPNFGGFITNTIGAFHDEKSDLFYPPCKKVSFNHNLNKSDGLLINHIAADENISYEAAKKEISNVVKEWKEHLEKGELKLNNVGTLKLNAKHQMVFEPEKDVNYLIESFGLTNVSAAKIERAKHEVKYINYQAQKKSLPLLKYAAAAAVFLTLGFMGNSIYQNGERQKAYTKQEQRLVQKIQSATFEISNPLPVIDLNVTRKIQQPYHIMAGSFQYESNAKKKVAALIKEGYKAKIIGLNDWGLTQVAFESFSNRRDAVNFLNKIKKTKTKDAWLLTK